MKRSALRFLACPLCRGPLELSAEREDGSEVESGVLACAGCDRAYRIAGGVPRFVDDGAYASSFGFQWNRFQAVQLDSLNGGRESERTLEATTGWGRADYEGRLVLDAGVGAGRFAEVVADKGGEVVGVDLTRAVDAAYHNVGRRERVHVVQADIFAMPFRDATFDLAYSIGVLHHTPDPAAAFTRVAAVVKRGGGLAVYLYAGYGIGKHFSDAIRTVTTRLPARLMLGMASAAVPLYYVYRVPVFGDLLQLVAPISMHRDWRWRWLDTFDWYTPRYQWKLLYPEVIRWFRTQGFGDVEVFDDPIRMRGTRTAGPRGELAPFALESEVRRFA
jgi:SAM-dependent methyltransferase